MSIRCWEYYFRNVFTFCLVNILWLYCAVWIGFSSTFLLFAAMICCVCSGKLKWYTEKFSWQLTVGAALFYTSAKENKNCFLLYKYLVHRLYGYQFSDAASVVEKDSVFMWVLCNCFDVFLFLGCCPLLSAWYLGHPVLWRIRVSCIVAFQSQSNALTIKPPDHCCHWLVK